MTYNSHVIKKKCHLHREQLQRFSNINITKLLIVFANKYFYQIPMLLYFKSTKKILLKNSFNVLNACLRSGCCKWFRSVLLVLESLWRHKYFVNSDSRTLRLYRNYIKNSLLDKINPYSSFVQGHFEETVVVLDLFH